MPGPPWSCKACPSPLVGSSPRTHRPPPARPPGHTPVSPAASQRPRPAAGSGSCQRLREGTDRGMGWLSILPASADTRGRVIHRPDPPQSQHGNAGHAKTGVRSHGQGRNLWCRSLARSARCVLGPKGMRAQPTTSAMQAHCSLSSSTSTRAPARPAAHRPRGGCEPEGAERLLQPSSGRLTRQTCMCLPSGACMLPSYHPEFTVLSPSCCSSSVRRPCHLWPRGSDPPSIQ